MLLSYVTVTYNVVEGMVSILAGVMSGSIALIGFGLDSAVESLSGGVMIWRFRLHGRVSAQREEQVERKAARLVGITFFILGLYVLYESAESLLQRQAPDPSPIGIIIAVVSLIVMPWLAVTKRRVGEAIGSRSLMADAKETFACAWLSAALLVGLGLNTLFGLWWADPAAGLIVAGFLFREGYETIFEDDECECDDDECEPEGQEAGEAVP